MRKYYFNFKFFQPCSILYFCKKHSVKKNVVENYIINFLWFLCSFIYFSYLNAVIFIIFLIVFHLVYLSLSRRHFSLVLLFFGIAGDTEDNETKNFWHHSNLLFPVFNQVFDMNNAAQQHISKPWSLVFIQIYQLQLQALAFPYKKYHLRWG